MYEGKPACCLSGPSLDGGYNCYCPWSGTYNEEPKPPPKKLSKKPRKSRAGTRKKPRCRYCRLPMKGHPRFTCGYDYTDTYPQHYDF